MEDDKIAVHLRQDGMHLVVEPAEDLEHAFDLIRGMDEVERTEILGDRPFWYVIEVTP